MTSSNQGSRTQRRLAAVLFADMVGYTRLMEESEFQALRLREEFHQLAAQTIPTYSGEIVKTMGDGFFAAFNSAVEAVRYALAFQKDLASRNRRQAGQRPLEARIGIHLGDLLQEGEDLFGSGVNVASRLEPLATPGGICISGEVYQQVRNQEGFSFSDLGERSLHNLQEPVRVYFVGPAEGERKMKPPEITAGQRAIAVLPFQNISPDPENEYFSDGITEEIITRLSKISGLKVTSRNTVFRYKGKAVDPREVGRELGVGSVLEGSVRKLGNSLRITAQLINAADGFHLWSEEYDRELRDVFGIQSDIAQRVGKALKVKLMPKEKQQIQKQPTQDVEAYTLYLRGRYYWNKRNEEGVKKGIEYFQQALDRDPNYALAHVGLADSYSVIADHGLTILPPREASAKAKAAATKALEIDETLAEAHTSLAWCLATYDWDWSGAEKEYERAIELNPKYPTAHHWYSLLLAALGRNAEALAEIKRAQELDPLSPIIQTNVGIDLFLAGQYEAARETLRNVLEIDPNFIPARFFLGQFYLAEGMFPDAISEFQKVLSLSGSHPDYLAVLGHSYAVAGQREEANRILQELKEQSERKHISPLDMVVVYAGLGEKEQAFWWLEKAYQERDPRLYFVKVGPLFSSLRSDPRFTELLKKMGLEK